MESLNKRKKKENVKCKQRWVKKKKENEKNTKNRKTVVC